MPDVTERFWAKVDQSGDCWIWRGALKNNGREPYGHFMPDSRRSGPRKTVGAHVYSYELAYGTVPAGHHVHHVCATTLCVRPDHLMAVTPDDHRLLSPNHNLNITHCRRGHRLAGDNLKMEDGRRRCLVCRRLTARERYAAERAVVGRSRLLLPGWGVTV